MKRGTKEVTFEFEERIEDYLTQFPKNMRDELKSKIRFYEFESVPDIHENWDFLSEDFNVMGERNFSFRGNRGLLRYVFLDIEGKRKVPQTRINPPRVITFFKITDYKNEKIRGCMINPNDEETRFKMKEIKHAISEEEADILFESPMPYSRRLLKRFSIYKYPFLEITSVIPSQKNINYYDPSEGLLKYLREKEED